ncbi:MAG TPA: type II toxin-antitoxin system HicA family toxin [Gemmatimonadaceae bacterium]
MTHRQRLLRRLLGGEADQTVRFDDLCGLLHVLGFDERRRGSHRIFTRQGIPEIINLQSRPDGTAKPYQLKQVRTIVLNRGLVSAVREERDDER